MKHFVFGALAAALAFFSAPATAQPVPNEATGLGFTGGGRDIWLRMQPYAVMPETWGWMLPQGPYYVTVVVPYTIQSSTNEVVLDCRLKTNAMATNWVDRATASISGNNHGGTRVTGSFTLMMRTNPVGGPQPFFLACGSNLATGTTARVERVMVNAIRIPDTAQLTEFGGIFSEQQGQPPQMQRR